MLKVKVITYNDIHLSINVAVLFISECVQHVYIGKTISVINSKLFWLDVSGVQFVGCNEDIFVNIL